MDQVIPPSVSSTAPPAGRPEQAMAAAPALLVDYHALLAGSCDAVMLYDLDQERLVDANRHAEALLGRSPCLLMQSDLVDLCPPLQPDGRLSASAIQQILLQVSQGKRRVFPLSFSHSGGGSVDCEAQLLRLPIAERRLFHIRLVDISGRKLEEALREGQNALLELVAQGAPLLATLDRLMRLIESQSDGVFCSVLLLAEDGQHVISAHAPRLPQSYLDNFNGLLIGPTVGSCGTAMFRKQAVVVSDIRDDPLWAPYRALAEPYGLRACWSMPIMNRDLVFGSFAMYYGEVRRPMPDEVHLIDVASHLAGIAIERTRHESELLRHRHQLEDLVARRTLALTAAKEQADLANLELTAALQHLRLTQDQLVRRDKLAALGALVAGIAHELNTPIGNSLMVASTMAEHTSQMQDSLRLGMRRSELQGYLDQASKADGIVLRNLERAARLVSSFKQIAVDHTSSQRRHFLLRSLVAELILPLHASQRQGIFSVSQQVGAELEMDSYPGPLGQVISSLFDNCVQHAFEGVTGGTITIGAHAGGQGSIVLTVADNGVGIRPTNLDQIYNPFFTTKLGTGGSGLGLHIVHNIVTGVLGGRIEASSDGSSGTVFTVTLPAVAPQAAA